MPQQYDAIVIGSGQAGNPLAKKLANAGKKTTIIEKVHVGGTCINDGCTPTKAMVASARAAYLAGRCNDLGVHIDGYAIDMPQIIKRKNEIVTKSKEGTEKALQETENLTLIMGEAVFSGSKMVTVKLNNGGEEQLQADLIFIDTGTQTLIPEIEGLKEVNYLTSTTILDLDKVPEHLLIVGGNYIGLEFGQMFKRFGSEVTLVEKSEHILSREDEDIADTITSVLKDEKVSIYTSASIAQVSKNSDGTITATLKINDEEKQVNCSHILIAAGRIPQTDRLNLDKTGVEVDDKGFIKVNGKLETNVPGIYALGDVKGGPAFTHIAYNDYTIVYRNLLKGENLTTANRPVPYCMFTDPQMGRIGISEKEARKQGLNIKVATLPMERVARAVEVGETRGLMKAIVDADTNKILGATIISEEGGEIVSVLQMAMLGEITAEQIRYCVFAHPTYTESLNNLFMPLFND